MYYGFRSQKLASLHGKQYKLSVPLYYILANKSHYKSHFARFYSIYIYYKAVKGIKGISSGGHFKAPTFIGLENLCIL